MEGTGRGADYIDGAVPSAESVQESTGGPSSCGEVDNDPPGLPSLTQLACTVGTPPLQWEDILDAVRQLGADEEPVCEKQRAPSPAVVEGDGSVPAGSEADNRKGTRERRLNLSLGNKRNPRVSYVEARKDVVREAVVIEDTPTPSVSRERSRSPQRPVMQQPITGFICAVGDGRSRREQRPVSERPIVPTDDTRSVKQLISDTLWNLFGPRVVDNVDIPTGEKPTPRQWLQNQIAKHSEGMRRRALIPHYFGLQSKVLAQKTLSEQGYRNRSNTNPNGCMRYITELMQMDPYFPLRHMIKLYPFYRSHAKDYDEEMQLLRDHDEPVFSTICIWVMGKA